MDDQTLKVYGYVISSRYRTNVLKALEDEVLMPKEIAEKSGVKINHISKVLNELKSAGVAECINEEVRKGRLYRLTAMGEEIVDNLD